MLIYIYIILIHYQLWRRNLNVEFARYMLENKYHENYAYLYNIFKRYLHVPANSVPSEKIFFQLVILISFLPKQQYSLLKSFWRKALHFFKFIVVIEMSDLLF